MALIRSASRGSTPRATSDAGSRGRCDSGAQFASLSFGNASFGGGGGGSGVSGKSSPDSSVDGRADAIGDVRDANSAPGGAARVPHRLASSSGAGVGAAKARGASPFADPGAAAQAGAARAPPQQPAPASPASPLALALSSPPPALVPADPSGSYLPNKAVTELPAARAAASRGRTSSSNGSSSGVGGGRGADTPVAGLGAGAGDAPAGTLRPAPSLLGRAPAGGGARGAAVARLLAWLGCAAPPRADE